MTLKFSNPIRDESINPFGLDFLVFGGAGFTITNGDFGGGGITDGAQGAPCLFAYSPTVLVSCETGSAFMSPPAMIGTLLMLRAFSLATVSISLRTPSQASSN